MQRCIQLAKNGIGTTRPNPSVGAVVVYNDKIIGEGYTSPYGGNHAEVNTINSVRDKSLLKESTIYVTLEPCSHHGKTPPCADLIVKHQIPNVVIGCIDTNSLVAGKGIERLQNSGCNVVVGVLEEECYEHHKRFFTVQNKKRPYVILKWAETKDGFIAPLTKDTQKPVWISNTYSQQLVHKWRAEEHAILVGTNTIIADNSKLNVRSWTGNNPVRIVLDKSLRIPENVNVFDKSEKTIVLTASKTKIQEPRQNVVYEEIDFSKNVAKQICEVLQKYKIQSVIIEGGSKTLQTFIDANLWDEARVFTGDVEFEVGVKSPIFNGKIFVEKKIQNDMLRIYKNQF
ncbi:diaminohydroxyphosphoribosylaminopyrimidine deaminase [Tenacibaculum adriaticum]|uniref:Riboflavin biosynthesis protein RibD n=2 Tax=Tenacibaculum adriaticum TaxID=413713 RepID=A0A5S5DWR2_9FLAO|nr:diaminohydroxyphosphoribosylaminopyrimidine deaminase [Tenacibaculum adriaticum]